MEQYKRPLSLGDLAALFTEGKRITTRLHRLNVKNGKAQTDAQKRKREWAIAEARRLLASTEEMHLVIAKAFEPMRRQLRLLEASE